MTKRLYYDAPYEVEFEAHILERRPVESGIGLVLDQTAFYPTSGGQPCDQGWLDDVPVTNVYEEGEQIVHVAERDVPGEAVRGRIQWARRFDHMQQHTGQHILSEAFQQLLGAATVSFHLGAEISTIDLDIAALSPEDVVRVEELVNSIIWEDRPISARFYEERELAGMPLRKLPGKVEVIRIVAIRDFDYSPCGGTHCASTGSVGLLKIRRWERRGQETRVEFLCGGRALRDYAWKHEAVMRLANAFGVQGRELEATVSRLSEEARETRRELQALRDQLLDYEAGALSADACRVGNFKIVRRIFEGRDQENVRHLALRIISAAGHIAVFGISDSEKGRLILACAKDVPGDMASVLRETCRKFGGGGGGQPRLAQGGGLDATRLEEALGFAIERIRAAIPSRSLDA